MGKSVTEKRPYYSLTMIVVFSILQIKIDFPNFFTNYNQCK